MLIFALIQSKFYKDEYKSFWCIKLLGFLLGLILIPVLYYTYTGISGKSIDFINIAIFFVAAASTYILETKLFSSNFKCQFGNTLSLLIILCIGIIFVLLTFFPFKIPLFRDPMTGTYGYKNKK